MKLSAGLFLFLISISLQCKAIEPVDNHCKVIEQDALNWHYFKNLIKLRKVLGKEGSVNGIEQLDLLLPEFLYFILNDSCGDKNTIIEGIKMLKVQLNEYPISSVKLEIEITGYIQKIEVKFNT